MSLKTIPYLGFRPFLPKKHGIKGVILHTILVVAVAVIPLVVVITVADGMIQGITNRYIETSSYHYRIFPPQPAVIDIEEFNNTSNYLLSINGIVNSHIERYGAGLGVTDFGREGVNIRGVSPDMLNDDSIMSSYIEITNGSFDLTEKNNVVLSSSLARKLKAEVGDDFRLITGKILKSGKILPRVTKFKIVGIIKTGYEDLDKSWVLIPYNTAIKILPDGNSKTFIGLKTKNPYKDLRVVYKDIKKVVPSGWIIQDWEQLNVSTYENFKTTEMVLALIMGLIVIVAGINISSSLIMLVLEKRKDISILKSMGLSPREVTGSYLLTGITIGIVGTIIGVVLGLFISLNVNSLILYLEKGINFIFTLLNRVFSISEKQSFVLLDTEYYLEHIPIDLNFFKLLVMTFFSIVTTSVASYLPARRAGLIKPLKVLQKY